MSLPPRIVLTRHAIEQGRERASRDAAEIHSDVLRALREGRVSDGKPAWLAKDHEFIDARGRRRRGRRLVWNAALTVAYVVVEAGNGASRVFHPAMTFFSGGGGQDVLIGGPGADDMSGGTSCLAETAGL